MPNVKTLLRDHVTLQVDCMDRLYLNGYVPLLQRPENLWWYLVKHKGCPVPSPVLLKKWVDSFVSDIRACSARNRIPVIQFARHERKEDVARRRLARFRHAGPCCASRALRRLANAKAELRRSLRLASDTIEDADGAPSMLHVEQLTDLCQLLLRLGQFARGDELALESRHEVHQVL